MNSLELDPSVEVVHLRRLLDSQPGCLLRLGADGTVLAANNAALMFLGVKSGAEALGRDFGAWLPPEQHDRWRAFTRGVVAGSPASIECDVVAPAGERYPALFHGVPLADHPDGEASMLVSARVIAVQRQLEVAIGDLRGQLRERGADRELQGLRAELRARDEAIEAADAARRAAEAKCAQALTDVRQLEMALNAFSARQKQVNGDRAADRQRAQEAAVRAELEEARAGRLQLEEAHAAVRAELEEAHAGRLRLEAALQESRQAIAERERNELEGRTERDALQRRLGEALSACQERDATLRQLREAHESLSAAHAAATAERDRLVGALRVHAMHLETLVSEIPGNGGGANRTDGASASTVVVEERRA